jgi:type IV pilus assembly protein PilY1
MTYTSNPPLFRRWLAGILSVLIGLGPLATPVYAWNDPLPTLLGDSPLNVTNNAPPNVVLTVDDSTSMLFDFLPDYVINAYCRDGTGKMASLCGSFDSNFDLTAVNRGSYRTPGYTFQQFGIPYPAYRVGDGTITFDASGPGSGCDTATLAGATCSGGISPGASPGIKFYPNPAGPPPGKSPNAGDPYEYWMLWPAPVHNSALNHQYYNPILTYDPAVYADATSYPQMNAANTGTWTRVPADPWAAAIKYIDLTTPVTVGQWCNSDWTQGINVATGSAFATDPGFCRINGLVAAASSGAPAADGDYTYPWSWPGGTAPRDPKYFDQNDNILYCDLVSTPQTCNNGTQTCNTSTCSAGTPQTCGAGTAQTCTGQTPQTCNPVPQVCNLTAQTCNATAQTCTGGGTQTCQNVRTQTCATTTGVCVGYVPSQTCANITSVCTPAPPSSCTSNWSPLNCNILCAGGSSAPECATCAIVTTCPPPTCVNQGTCSSSGLTCTAANAASVCTSATGSCSNNSATSCTTNSQCPVVGKCSVTDATCTSNANCPTQSGTCSRTSATCMTNAECPTQPGTCSITNATCTSSATCPAQNRCSITNATCTSVAQCPQQGRCSLSNATCTTNANCPAQNRCSITNATCTAANAGTRCPPQNGRCSITNATCTTDANCPNQDRRCTSTGASCTSNSNCPAQDRVCNGTSTACTSNSQCGGTCSVETTKTCTNNNGCRGTCSVSGAACTGSGVGNCAVVPGAVVANGCASLLPSSTTTFLADANGAGTYCRRNNQAYADGTVASRYNYPSGRFTTAVTGGTGANACTATPRFASIPRHYWKTEVEWCDKAVATAGDKWLGYGTATGGSCQASRDATHIVPRFYKFGAAPGTSNYTTPAFQRVDLDIAKRASATYTHAWTDDTGSVQTITRSFDEEMTNYANWFAYYRTRIQAVKTVTSLSFLAKLGNTYNVDNKFRVGFHRFYNDKYPTSFVNVAAFNLPQKAAWATQLFGIDIPLGQDTPTLDAISRIGDYYKNGASAQLSGATDPITLSCQKNWHMLFTDGFTHQNALPTVTVGNADNTVTLPFGKTVAGLTVGSAWPPLFVEDAATATTSNSASDYATYYWATDLRTTGAMALDNVPAAPDVYSGDPADWQHQNFAALSLGTEGKLPADNQSNVELALRAGTTKWPVPYPLVNLPDQSGVDDLWHAAINGHGRFVNAQSADELKIGIGQILGDIMSASGVRAGVGFRSVNLGTGVNYGYKVGFSPGWSGSVIKLVIDPLTGAEQAGSDVWSAGTQLASQLTIVPGVKDTPWFTERNIVTMNPAGTGVPFLWGSLSTAQQDSLAPGKPVRGQAVVEFLRGNQTLEGNKTGQLRIRKSVLGDIVAAQPVYVGPPNAPYLDPNDPGYSTFVSSNSGRVGRVYVGANDGMMHVLDDATGNEAWAYVPKALFRGDDTGLGALAYQDGALPPFRHHPYVDSTPRITDVDFGGQDWHTLLVGGLGKGGKSYYAIDVTKPADVISEATAAGKVLWEFTDTDMGFSYGRPMIAKTRAYGWVVVVASGYDNATGDGKLYFLNPRTGAQVRTPMSTGAGTATNPSGLTHIAGYTQDYRNQLVEQIYAGDLLGNLWRFDVSDPTASNWAVEKLATLIDASGTRQPVTTPPQMEIDVGNGVDRWVFIGTGRLLHDSDLASTQIQTMYAFRDGTATTPGPIGAAVSRTTTGMLPVTDGLNGLTTTRPDKGWYFDMPAGERIIVPVQAALSVVGFIGTKPQTDPCVTGQPATIYAKGFASANSVLLDPISGNLTDAIDSPQGAVGLEMIIVPPAPGEPPGEVHLQMAVTMGTTGNIMSPKIKLPDFVMQHRMSWRLLAE